MPRFYETLDNRLRREESDRVKYSELEIASYNEIAEVDAFSRATAQPQTQFGRDAEDAQVRLGFTPEEVGDIERRVQPFQPSIPEVTTDFTPRQPFTPAPPRGQLVGEGGAFALTLEDQFQRDQSRAFRLEQSERRKEFEAERESQINEIIRQFEAEIDAAVQEGDIGHILDVRAQSLEEDIRANPPTGAALLQQQDPSFQLDPRLSELRALQDPARNLTGFLPEKGQEIVNTVVAQLLDGERFIDDFIDAVTIGEHGIEDIPGYERSPELVKETVRALAPINIAIAARGGGISTTLRNTAARPGTGVLTRKTLNGIATVVEPFSNASFGGRLAREVAVDVAAQEGFRRSEGLPGSARFAVGLGAAALTGAGTDPRVLSGINQLGQSTEAAIRQADPTAALRTASVEPPSLAQTARRQAELGRGPQRGADDVSRLRQVLNLPASASDADVIAAGQRELRNARHIAAGGGTGSVAAAQSARARVSMLESLVPDRPSATAATSEPFGPLTQLDSARSALKTAYTEERVIRGRGIPQEELTAGRAQQARGVQRALEAGAQEGLSGDELIARARQGAAVPGGIRETFAEAVDLTEGQRNALLDELARTMRAGEIDSFEFLNTARALDRLVKGEGLRQFEIDNPALRALVGDEVVTAVGSRGPRETIDAADAAVRRETQRFIDTAERANQRALEAQQRVDVRALDAQIKALEEPIDITTGTGARALLAQPEVEDVVRARREVELLASRTETRAVREADKVRLRELDREIKRLEQQFDREVRAFNRADAAEITRIRRELAQIDERSATGTARDTARATIRDLDARIAQLEEPIDPSTPIGVRASFIDEAATLKDSAVRARNAADEAVARETSRLNQQAMTRQLNARTRAEAKEFRQGFNLTEALESRHPNTITLTNRASELMNRPITGTPRGEIPRGVSGKAIGPRAIPDQPRVPQELRTDVLMTINEWLKGTDARLANQSVEGMKIVRAVQATINGQLDSPALTQAVYRRSVLVDALVAQGAEPQIAREVADVLMTEQLGVRWGEAVTEIRANRKDATTAVRNRMRAEQGLQTVDDTTDEFRKLVDEELASRFLERLGASALAQERRINEQLELLNGPSGAFAGLDEFVQAAKNTQFGVWDVGVLGIQLPTALNRGGIPLMVKMINEGLAVLHLPNARHLYSESFLPSQIHKALAGVDQSSKAAVYEAGSPSLAGRYFGAPGRAIDRPLTRVADAMTEFQFGTILGGVRNAAYDGYIVLLHITGHDTTDPLVQQTAATFANNVGSSALPALRGNRNVAERILVTSARMTRARFNAITLAAKLITPSATSAERTLAAVTIASNMFYMLAFAETVNRLVGLTPFQMDPSKPGFGLITVANPDGGEPRIIDTVPQDSVARAFARSIRELKDGDPQEAANAWARVYYGSASIIGRIPTTAFGYGYEPGAGFREGDMTTQGKIESLAPVPPVFQFLHEEGIEPFGLSLEAAGIGNFPEGSYGQGNRLLESAGKDPDELNARERDQELADLGVLHEVSELRREELEDRAERGDREAQALLLKYEKRDEKQRIYDEETDGGTKAQYRDRTRDVDKLYVGKNSAFEDIWRSFGESDDEVVRLAGERYELIDQVMVGTEPDYDALEELQAEFDAALDPTVREDVYAYIESIDSLENPWEQELDLLKIDIADAGWYDLRDTTWTELGFAERTGFESFNNWRVSEINRGRALHEQDGISPGVATERAEDDFMGLELKQDLDEIMRRRRIDWLFESNKNIAIADQMIEWGIWTSPPNDALEIIENRLGG